MCHERYLDGLRQKASYFLRRPKAGQNPPLQMKRILYGGAQPCPSSIFQTWIRGSNRSGPIRCALLLDAVNVAMIRWGDPTAAASNIRHSRVTVTPKRRAPGTWRLMAGHSDFAALFHAA